MNETSEELRKKIRDMAPKLLLRDRVRFRNAFRALPRFRDEELAPFLHRLENASANTLERFAKRLDPALSEDLPVTGKANEIAELLRKNPVVIVCGSTGSGKTTQLPKIALSLGLGNFGRIGCTQPRRIAAAALARRVASETKCECGQEVGYKVRFDDHTGRGTVIKFMTEGILLAETRTDRNLLEYECLILDEVHERSLNIDFLLGYVKLLLQRRHDLKVIISSATLDAERISSFFNNAPVVEVEGKLYPVEDVFLPSKEEEELSEAVAKGVEYLEGVEPQGDILVFLPGESEIRDCAEVLEGRFGPHTEVLPLFGRLSAGDQQKVFHPGKCRRIVLSTNVAETSLTIPGIRFVIDSGLVRLSRYNPRSRIQELPVERISQASAKQRRGRCGRLRDGVCVHLYSEEEYGDFSPFTPPEIQRSSLAGVILQMAALKLGRLEDFPLIDPPESALIREGRQVLDDLLACDSRGELTPLGWKMAAIPADPHLAKMILTSEHYKVRDEILVIAAYLSIPDPRERPAEHAQAADDAHRKYSYPESDFIGILHLHCAIEELLGQRNSHQALRQFAKKNYYNYRRLREWRNLLNDLREEIRVPAGKISLERLSPDAVHKTILTGIPRQLGCFDPESRLYSEMKGKKFVIFPGSVLAKLKKSPQWLLFSALVETSRVFARINASVKGEWLEQVAPHLCTRSYDCVRWDEETGFVTARERVMCGQLLIHPGRRCHYGKYFPVEARKVFIREALCTGKAFLKHSWLDGFQDLLNTLKALEIRMRNPDGIVDTEAIYQHFDKVLPPSVCSIASLKEHWNSHHQDFSPDPDAITLIPFEEIPETDYPDHLLFSEVKFPLEYAFDPGEDHDGITLKVKEEYLNLLNPYVLDFLTPGYLEQKIDFVLRSLPKQTRKALFPIEEACSLFMEEYRSGGIFKVRRLYSSLCEFLNHLRGMDLHEEDLEAVELPEYLQMKLCVRDKDGHLKIYREFPSAGQITSRLSAVIPGTKRWTLKGYRSWPEAESLPQSVPVSGKGALKAYPALTDEGESIGRALYLNEEDARKNHRRAILKLWRMELNQILRPLRHAMKLPYTLELEFFISYPEWQEDLIDLTAEKALGGDLWMIRTPEEFLRRREDSRDHVADEVELIMEELTKLGKLLPDLRKQLKRFREECELAEDVSAELDLFFRPGFLKTPELFFRTERYLKSLKIRLDRGWLQLEKDRSKFAPLESYVNDFRLALDMTGGLEKSVTLLDFALLLEEARIGAFSPEMRPLVKCSAAALNQGWDQVEI